MHSSVFKICVIGCGEIAFGYHGPAYAQYAANYPYTELAGCYSRSVNKAALFAKEFGFRNYYTDIIEMVKAEQPSVVCINVPPEVICEIACSMFQRGIPTLLEKPPGMTVAEIDRMIIAAEECNTINQVAFNRRFMPLTKVLKDSLEPINRSKDIQHIQIEFTRVNRGNEDFSTTAIHGIDLARFIVGSDFSFIKFSYQDVQQPDVQAVNTFLDGSFNSGVTAHLSFLPVAGVGTERCTVYTYDNTFYLQLSIWNEHDTSGRLTRFENGKKIFELTGIEAAGSVQDFVINGFYSENESFFNKVREEKQIEVDLRQSRQSVEIMEAIRDRRLEFIAK